MRGFWLKANQTFGTGLLFYKNEKFHISFKKLFEHSIIIVNCNECFAQFYWFFFLLMLHALIEKKIIIFKVKREAKRATRERVREGGRKRARRFRCHWNSVVIIENKCRFLSVHVVEILLSVCVQPTPAPIKLSAFDYFSIKCNYFNLDLRAWRVYTGTFFPCVTYAYPAACTCNIQAALSILQ